MEERIARHLKEVLGYGVPTLVRSQSELESVTTFEPSEPASTLGRVPALRSILPPRLRSLTVRGPITHPPP